VQIVGVGSRDGRRWECGGWHEVRGAAAGGAGVRLWTVGVGLAARVCNERRGLVRWAASRFMTGGADGKRRLDGVRAGAGARDRWGMTR
jgi:hypothetical protein